MAKTLIDIDDVALAQAAELLGTATKKDTVNAALRKIVADRRRVESLVWMMNSSRDGVFTEILDTGCEGDAQQ